ncbi:MULTISPECIES: metal ABC transporter permease [Pseudomonas]|uniref:Manganese/iron transport system permease protein n=1 Tax=Pseudomonas hunanensis TaxID=1247546 RepID=A0ACC6K5Q4_9PSED|nr:MULTISPECIES: metal ABC transporter permease [Pseudomonas]MBP2261923.1 manganese/iron transport system permease protein [Pseudomonas sp. BP8]MDR6713804.1 manganese/iron transport system permease protein [Pseudomonas hunanensis]HDS1734720.1 metal ABC transporter permease [Pseudomonas putida]
MSWLGVLLEPFGFDFMVSAMAIALLIAIPMALLSCFLVLKGWALLGDAIAHAVFPGVVIAYILHIPYAIGAFVAGMFCAIATGFLKDNSRIKQDTVMGIVYSGMFGLGLVLYLKIESDVHLDHILFGDILGANNQDLWMCGGIALLTCVVIATKWKDFMLHTFDAVQAHAVGLRSKWLHYGLLCLISLAVVGALKASGVILAIALLIAPGAIAALLTRQLKYMLWVALLVAMVCAFLGVYLSFFLDSAPAPTIVVVFAIVFMLALGYHAAVPGADRAVSTTSS